MAQGLIRLRGDARPHLQQPVLQQDSWCDTWTWDPHLCHLLHVLSMARKLFMKRSMKCMCVCPGESHSLVCARELLKGWDQVGLSSTHFCWVCSHWPVRAAGMGSHTAMVLLCLLVEWCGCSGLLVPPPLSAGKICVLPDDFLGSGGRFPHFKNGFPLNEALFWN